MSAQLQDIKDRAMLAQMSRRPVARRACLACREKKIKCDGEPPPASGVRFSASVPSTCSNCRYSGTECVFIPSNRGGRRRRNPETGSIRTSVSNASRLSETPSGSEEPQGFQHFKSHEAKTTHNTNDNDEAMSSFSGPDDSRDYSRRDGSAGSPRGSRYNDRAREDNFHNPFAHPPPPPPFGFPPPPPPFRHHQSRTGPYNYWGRGGPPHMPPGGHHLPPPPPLPPHYHHYGGPPPPPPPHEGFPHAPPPPPVLPPISDAHGRGRYYSSSGYFDPYYVDSESYRSSVDEKSVYGATSRWVDRQSSIEEKELREKGLISETPPVKEKLETGRLRHLTDEILAEYDFPKWEITAVFVDLFYRYVHPARPIFPNKRLFLQLIDLRSHASLLHAILAVSSYYASPKQIVDPALRKPAHWHNLVEKHWENTDVFSAPAILMLLSGSIVPEGHWTHSNNGFEKMANIIRLYGLIDCHSATSPLELEELLGFSSWRQILDRERELRAVWSVWYLKVYLRANFDYPYENRQEFMVKFPATMDFPVSEQQFYVHGGMAKTVAPDGSEKLEGPVDWGQIQSELSYFSNRSPPPDFKSVIYDASAVVVATKLLEDVMDIVGRNGLTTNSFQKYSSQTTALQKITKPRLYSVEDFEVDKRKMRAIVIHGKFLQTQFICNLSLSILNLSYCSKMLIFNPQVLCTASKNFLADVAPEELPQVSQVLEEITKAESRDLTCLFQCVLCAWRCVNLVELGDGISSETVNMGVLPAVIGPTSFESALSLGHKDASEAQTDPQWWKAAFAESHGAAAVLPDPTLPDVWLQYPIFSLNVVVKMVPILASACILSKVARLRAVHKSDTTSTEGEMQLEISVRRDATTWTVIREITAPIEDGNALLGELEFDSILEKLRTVVKFLYAHAAFFPAVNLVHITAEKYIKNVVDVVATL